MPKWDDIEGGEIAAPPTAAKGPRWEDIDGEEVTDLPADFDYTAAPAHMGPVVATSRAIQPGTAERAATLGVAQGGTMGFADEIGGAIGSLLVPESSVKLGPAAMPSASDSEEEFQAKANLIEGMANTPTSYELVRDRMRNEAKEAKEQHGAAYMAGEIGGGIAGTIAGNILVPGGGMVGRAAMEGAAAGLGSSEADLLKGEVAGAVADTAFGGAVGGLAGMAGGAIARRLPGAAQATQEGAEGMARERALKAAGYIQKDIPRQAGPRARLMERAGLLLDEPGLITPGASAEAIGQRAADAAQDYGENAIGALLKQADDKGASFDPSDFLQKAYELADEVARDPALRHQAMRLRSLARGYFQKAWEMAERGEQFTFQEANKLKGSLQAAIFNQRGDVKTNYELANRLQRIFTDEIDGQLENALGPEAGAVFREAKKRYGALVGAAEKGAQGANRSLGNNMLGLTDYLAANAAAAVGGGPVAAAATGALSNAVRGRLDSAAAVALRGLSGNALLRKAAELSPDMLGQFAGPISAAIARGADGDDSALSAVDYVLQQTNPAYRAMKEALAKEAQ